MRIKFNKDIEFFIKKLFFKEKYLLKKRLNRAIKNNYDYLITMDADLSHNPKDILKFLSLVSRKYCFLVGVLSAIGVEKLTNRRKPEGLIYTEVFAKSDMCGIL